MSSQDAALVAIHDSARPLVKAEDVRKCLKDALEVLTPFMHACSAAVLSLDT